jgi:anhydro-N-acetylmuramic acid kinase
MCDSTRLAELSGVTVIDSFPARDLAVGGSGKGLEALPLWMIFADRSETVADQTRALVTFSETNQGYIFPASDGRDAEIPAIEMFESLGLGFLSPWLKLSNEKDDSIDELLGNTEFKPIAELKERWRGAIAETRGHRSGGHRFVNAGNGYSKISQFQQLNEHLFAATDSFLKKRPDAQCDVLGTAIEWNVDLMLEQLKSSHRDCIDQLFVSCQPRFQSFIVTRMTQAMGDVVVRPTSEYGVTYDQLDSVIAALLGLFHIDQMPANVPWLTGADGQRILGRLTPGRPSNWRQLVRVMADFSPILLNEA